MQTIVKLNTSRDYYGIREAADSSITVEELINALSSFNPEDKVVFSNDKGYTYGAVYDETVEEERVETYEEERRREELEEAEKEIAMVKDEMESNLTGLEVEYENPDNEDAMTDEEYERQREEIIKMANDEIDRIKREYDM
jgi:hypothetical protein